MGRACEGGVSEDGTRASLQSGVGKGGARGRACLHTLLTAGSARVPVGGAAQGTA